MEENFGHAALRLYGGDLAAFVDGWGSGPFIISIDGKSYRFGDSDRFGPYLANKHVDPIKNPYPAESSQFWRAHRIWKKQGRRLKEDGITCIWDEPKPHKIMLVSGRNFITIENGEEDGKIILIDRDTDVVSKFIARGSR